MLEQRLKEHEQQVTRLRAKLNDDNRKRDTRRKILIGALIESHVATDHELRRRVGLILDHGLTRPDDRALLQDLLPGRGDL